jgi:Flp pilus assembly protein TadD
MRWITQSTLLSMVLTLLPPAAHAQLSRDQDVTGRVTFGDAGFNCERVMIQLEVMEMQPVDSTYLDTSCGFRFTHVSPGSYFLHINVEGYEEVHQPVHVSDSGASSIPSQISMMTSPIRRQLIAPGGRQVVDVSELLDQYPHKAVDLFHKGVQNHKKGRNEQAATQIEQAIKLAPDFYQAHNTLGLVYRDLGRMSDAEAEFMRAHQINRYSPEPLVNLSALYLDQNDPKRAAEVSQEAVETNSRSVPALFNLGMALYRMSRLDKAEETFERILDIAPKMAQVRLALANVYLKLGKYDSLLEQLNAYLKDNPKGQEREQVERLKQQVLQAQEEDGS